ncbi:unnamed protein product [Didymodactylos carnosus]|uniref:Myosin heavy chain n=1 Tax=Didymodactylos carnosus TaxID=1234261 RepID=A0A813W2V2_9BILA|nr:unnamed protein product [Didymodactylos carnosus]CAF3639235.1 unnamed protein product [Didymodactylos carnosus]
MPSIMDDHEPAEMKYLRSFDSLNKDMISDATTSNEWAAKKYVWVPDEQEGFVRGTVKHEQHDGLLTVELDGGKRINFHKDDTQRVNPPKFSKIEDMSELTCLNDASVLYNLKERYYSGLIYTYSGLFCVVVNPYKRLPIYSENVIELYKGKKREQMPPHIFAIAGDAYRLMLQNREDQSILCTGESGAGKTENTKKVIQYLAYIAAAPKSSQRQTPNTVSQYQGELEAQLLQANPILEAFGNAKTVKNDNSSRFGKFIRINFDTSGFIAGASIETYLLEKSRAIRQAKEERTFHIFYQLLRGANTKMITDYLLEDFSRYHYLSHGNVNIPGTDDSEEFQQTVKSMQIMGMSLDDLNSIFRTISAVLQMGNMQFKQERNSDQATLPDNTVAQKVCHLFGINVTDFVRSFLKPKLKVGRDFVTKAQSQAQVEYAVEAISKAVYERMFKWIVQRINKSLDRSKRQGASFIGILDIAGFEIFTLNSFEQLCINYTNEKLQQLFNHTMFVLEQEEYRRENIDWEFVDFGLDLQPTIDLIEKQMGILSLLDEECWFPKATDRTYVDKLINSHAQHPKFGKPNFKSTSDFSIIHYAGKVEYSADQWLMKNMDPLNDNVVALLQTANDPFTRDLWKDVIIWGIRPSVILKHFVLYPDYTEIVGLSAADPNDATSNLKANIKKGMFRTVGQLYKEQLTKLMSTLKNTNPNFVRCILPNQQKKAGLITSPLVLEQLRCNGVLEGIRICRNGFPNRILFQEFRQRYEILCPNVIPKGFMDGKAASQRMIKELELDENLYRIGLTKIFFRSGVLGHLEEERDLKLTDIITQLQALCRGVLARKNYQKRIQQLNAIRIIQRNGRALMKIRNWKWWRLFTKIKPLLQVTRQDEELTQKQDEIKRLRIDLDQRTIQIQEFHQQLHQTQQERTIINEKLVQLTEAMVESDENQRRVQTRKIELENIVQELEQRLDEEIERSNGWTTERKILEQKLQDITEQLEEEEHGRQKLQIERVQFEGKIKNFEDIIAGQQNDLAKLQKERKFLEDKVQEINHQQLDEGEKFKQLLKIKTKQETICNDLEEKLKREIELRQKLEREIRRLESELQEIREQLQDRTQQVQDLQAHLARREEELTQAVTSAESEAASKTSFQRQLREFQTQIQDLQDDIEGEKESRKRLEREKRELMEENESLRNELLDRKDFSNVIIEQQKKRDDEFSALNRALDQARQDREHVSTELRTKYTKQIEEITDQFENMKKQQQTFLKDRQQQQTEMIDKDTEIKNLNAQKQDIERKRRQLETYLNELQHKYSETDRIRIESQEKLQRYQMDLEQLNTNYIESEQRAQANERSISMMRQDIQELQENLQEENRQKMNALSKLRQQDDVLNDLKDQLEEKEEEKNKVEQKLIQMSQQVNELRRQVGQVNVEQMEELRRQLQREKEGLLKQVEDMQNVNIKLTKSNQKFSNDITDVTVELERYRTIVQNVEKQQRTFDKRIQDEKIIQEKLRQERDSNDREIREKETQRLNLLRDLEEKSAAYEDLEKRFKQLRVELDDMLSRKDDIGKYTHELERIKRTLETTVDEQKQQILELEDELQAAEDARLRGEVNMGALKQQIDKNVQDINEQIEDRMRLLQKQLRDNELELEEERKVKTQVLNQRKKFEMDIQDMRQQFEEANRQKEDALRNTRRLQTQVREVTREVEEIKVYRSEAIANAKEWQNKIKTLEHLLQQALDEKDLIDRQRRQAQTERDELQQEMLLLSGKDAFIDEKRRLESRIAQLEEELEDEQTNSELNLDKHKKSALHVEQLMLDFAAEKSNNQKAEAVRANLERQNRELREKLEEFEEFGKGKSKALLGALEAKVHALEEQLDVEVREKQKVTRSVRSIEKRLREAVSTAEESKKQADTYKEQAEKANARVRAMKRALDDLEEEVSQLKGRLRKAQREKDELDEIVTVQSSQTKTRSVFNAIPDSPSAAYNSSTSYVKTHITKYYSEMSDDDLQSEATNASVSETLNGGRSSAGGMVDNNSFHSGHH